MKKTALLAAAAAMMMATPAAAQGYVGLEYSSTNLDFGAEFETDAWQGEGAFGFGGTGSWGAQLDASFGNISGDSGDDIDTYTLGGHLWWQGSGWRLGGVVTTTNLADDGGGELDEIQYGVEGTWDLGPRANLFSSYMLGEVDTGGTADLSNWDFGANFYASPNIRLGGFYGVGNIDFGFGDVDTTSFGINGEFQPWSAPVSITLAWNNFELDDGGASSDVLSIGARWNFGGGTLQERNNATPFDTNTGYVNRLYGVW